jgi:hypothetical protein
MFTPVPPQDDPPPAVAPDIPDEEDEAGPPVPSIRRPYPRLVTSRRGRIIKFALLGGGGASIGFGVVLGVLAWMIIPPEVVPFPSTDRFTFLSSEQRLVIWPFALTLLIAPFMIVVFAMAASAQVVASSFSKRAESRTERRGRGEG